MSARAPRDLDEAGRTARAHAATATTCTATAHTHHIHTRHRRTHIQHTYTRHRTHTHTTLIQNTHIHAHTGAHTYNKNTTHTHTHTHTDAHTYNTNTRHRCTHTQHSYTHTRVHIHTTKIQHTHTQTATTCTTGEERVGGRARAGAPSRGEHEAARAQDPASGRCRDDAEARAGMYRGRGHAHPYDDVGHAEGQAGQSRADRRVNSKSTTLRLRTVGSAPSGSRGEKKLVHHSREIRSLAAARQPRGATTRDEVGDRHGNTSPYRASTKRSVCESLRSLGHRDSTVPAAIGSDCASSREAR